MSVTESSLLGPRRTLRAGSASIKANRLLKSLSTADRAALVPDLEPVSLATWQVIEQPNRRITHVYFPTSGSRSAWSAMKA